MTSVILASESPRRRELLKQAGIEFEIVPSNIDESEFSEEGISPKELVTVLSLKKATDVTQKTEGDAIIIAADTVVYVGDEILGKPKDAASAFLMLKKLQGRQHAVYTGVTVIKKSKARMEIKNVVDTTDVTMRSLRDDEIHAYIKTGEPFDKAGAYAIQGRGSLLIEKIDGDYNNVVGLPLVKVYVILEAYGVSLSSIWE